MMPPKRDKTGSSCKRDCKTSVLSAFFGLGLLVLISSVRVQSDVDLMRYLDQVQGKSGVKLASIDIDQHLFLALSDELASHFVDCAALQESFRNGGIVHKDPNQGEQILAHVTQTPGAPPFRVSIHNQSFDKMRWILYNRGRYYESNLEEFWARILRQAPPRSRILDVGGNIGYYALYSAALGPFAVDVFEPNPVNLLRTCQSLEYNQWSHEFGSADTLSPRPAVNLWQWGISNITDTLSYVTDENPGAGYVEKNDYKPEGHLSHVTEIRTLDVTTLDAFAQSRGFLHDNNVRIEILKIDVEKHEAQVLLGARALLNRRVIRNVFVEWNGLSDRRLHTRALQVLLDAGYTLCGWGGYKGPTSSLPFDAKDRIHFIENFHSNLDRRRQPMVNAWWQLDANCRSGSVGAQQD